MKKQNSNNLKLYLKNSQFNSNLQANAVFPKKLYNSLGEKKTESLTNLEKIYMTRMNVPKNPQAFQNYKSNSDDNLFKKTSNQKNIEETSNNNSRKNSFVFKLKAKMKRSNTPNDMIINEDTNPSKSYKNLYNNNGRKTMKRSASSSNKKKMSESTTNMKRNNNFLLTNHEGVTTNNIELKNIQNLGIQINNNINVFINSNNNDNINLIKPLTNELNNSSNNIVNTKITLNGKKVKNTNNGFMGKSKQKFNKINEVMMALTNQRKNQHKEEKLIIFPTDYLKTLPVKDNRKIEVGRNNYLTKDNLSKSQNNLESKS